MDKKLTVSDFFCGAGGFSEGFRQQGFEIVAGYDNWRPAVDTFAFNFGEGKGYLRDILDFELNADAIDALPDTDIIIGSPPCVSFSNSNRSGKSDKSLGIKLTKSFLRIIAIKKHKPNSVLKAWFMENVAKSIQYTSKDYSFNQLGLKNWARNNGYDPNSKAISLTENHFKMNSADYGCPQKRIRAVAGEIIKTNKFYVPETTHRAYKESRNLPDHLTLGLIKSKLVKPNSIRSNKIVADPLYPEIKIKLHQLTDHFYDTGLYKSHWHNSYYMKRNHPFMGKMSFPENETKPSRTITATNIGTSREAIIYKSEYERIGDGQFRIPTVREMACLMGFPITFQFLGRGESSKCRLVGNAVCPPLSRALAKMVRKELELRDFVPKFSSKKIDVSGINNLNSFEEKRFHLPPIKNKGSRFRRHPFKYGNITVSLSNYDITANVSTGKWLTSVQYGNGEGFPSNNYPNNFYKKLEPIINGFEGGKHFLEIINNGFTGKIASGRDLQKMYEQQLSFGSYLEPTELVTEVARIIDRFNFEKADLEENIHHIFFYKKIVPKKQLLALYAINKICSIANKKAK